ncbi:hypothetical protein K04M5_35670 [Vibrio alginolyticus]|nr:hypothetical protein K04M5_35670 [Vibrio alginolyticus]
MEQYMEKPEILMLTQQSLQVKTLRKCFLKIQKLNNDH